MTTQAPDNFILYDGECPVCSAYMALTRLRDLRPDIAMIDARHSPGLVAWLRASGHDVNQGVIVCISRRVFIGPQATRLLYQLSSENPLLHRWALYVLVGGPWSDQVYPALRACRNGLLRALGRSQIG